MALEKRRLFCVLVRQVSTKVGFFGIFCEGPYGNVTPQDAAKFRAQIMYVDKECTVADGNLFESHTLFHIIFKINCA
jgi:hypothetical protein